jgi:hypothetical protein
LNGAVYPNPYDELETVFLVVAADFDMSIEQMHCTTILCLKTAQMGSRPKRTLFTKFLSNGLARPIIAGLRKNLQKLRVSYK